MEAYEEREENFAFEKRYALGVPSGKEVLILGDYDNIEKLGKDYCDLRKQTDKKGITKPVPIELLDKKGKCKVLTDLIRFFDMG